MDSMTLVLAVLHALLLLLGGQTSQRLLHLLCHLLFAQFLRLRRLLLLILLTLSGLVVVRLILLLPLLSTASIRFSALLLALSIVVLPVVLLGSSVDVHLIIVDAVALLLLTRALTLLALRLGSLTLLAAFSLALAVGTCLAVQARQVNEAHLLELHTGFGRSSEAIHAILVLFQTVSGRELARLCLRLLGKFLCRSLHRGGRRFLLSRRLLRHILHGRSLLLRWLRLWSLLFRSGRFRSLWSRLGRLGVSSLRSSSRFRSGRLQVVDVSDNFQLRLLGSLFRLLLLRTFLFLPCSLLTFLLLLLFLHFLVLYLLLRLGILLLVLAKRLLEQCILLVRNLCIGRGILQCRPLLLQEFSHRVDSHIQFF